MHDRPSRYRRSSRSTDRIRSCPPEDKRSDTGANVRAGGITMLIAFVLMALFNSGDFRSFTRDLPGSRLTDQLVMGADHWHQLMLTLGPAHARPAVHEVLDRLRKMRW